MNKNSEYIFGTSTFMCNKCFELQKIKFTINILSNDPYSPTAKITSLENVICQKCNKQVNLIRVDSLIANSVSLLCKKGYKVSSANQGRKGSSNHKCPAFVGFKSPAKELFKNLPKDWYFDKSNDSHYIRGLFELDNIEYDKERHNAVLNQLEDWVKTLPNA